MKPTYYIETKTGALYYIHFTEELPMPLSAKEMKRLVQVGNKTGRLRRLSQKEYLEIVGSTDDGLSGRGIDQCEYEHAIFCKS